ncbi:MAG: hypothetical protein R3E12_18895 [Candidatus Eisenbacteria bacterium]
MIHQALAPYFQSTMAMLEAPEIEPGFDLLERAIRLYFTFLRNNPSVVRLLAWSQAIQVRQSSPKLLDPELCASPMALGAERLTEAQNAGRIRSDIPPVHIIKLFLDLCLAWHMSVLDFCLDIGTDPNDTTTVDRMHEAHLEFILATLRSGLALEPAQNGEAR